MDGGDERDRTTRSAIRPTVGTRPSRLGSVAGGSARCRARQSDRVLRMTAHANILTAHRSDNVTGCVPRPVPLRDGSHRPVVVDPDSSVRSRSPSPADRSSSTRARRWRSSRSSPRKVGRSPGTSSRRCSGRTRTTRRPAARSGGRCRRCGDAVGDSGLLIDRARVALDLDRPTIDLARGRTARERRRDSPISNGPPRSPGARSWLASPCGTARPSTTGRRPGRPGSSGWWPISSTGWPRHGWRPATRRRGGGRTSPRRRGPARRARPASTHRAARPVRRPHRRDPPVPLAGRGLRSGARRDPAAGDDRAVRIHPRTIEDRSPR